MDLATCARIFNVHPPTRDRTLNNHIHPYSRPYKYKHRHNHRYFHKIDIVINGKITTISQTQTVLGTTSSTVLSNGTASVASPTGANSSLTYVLYKPGNSGDKIELCLRWFVVTGLGLVALSI